MIPGDGVGPELCESVKMVFAAAGVPVDWNEIAVRFVTKCLAVPYSCSNFDLNLSSNYNKLSFSFNCIFMKLAIILFYQMF